MRFCALQDSNPITAIARRSKQVIEVKKVIYPENFAYLLMTIAAIDASQVSLSGRQPVLRTQFKCELVDTERLELRCRRMAAESAPAGLAVEQAVELKKAFSDKQLFVVPRGDNFIKQLGLLSYVGPIR